MDTDSELSALQGHLNYIFQDLKILERALTHTSAGAADNNERLEFLGDRVLGLAMAEMLLNTFPNEDEGAIARRFAELVRAEKLTEIGRAVGIDAVLKLSGQAANEGMVADATEAVIAALYIDGGFPAAAQFIEHQWSPLINRTDAPPLDAKTALQEWSQAQGIGLPKYRDIDREGPDHEPLFTVEVTVQGSAPARAQGTSKRAAEQDAAALLLTQLGVGDAG